MGQKEISRRRFLKLGMAAVVGAVGLGETQGAAAQYTEPVEELGISDLVRRLAAVDFTKREEVYERDEYGRNAFDLIDGVVNACDPRGGTLDRHVTADVRTAYGNVSQFYTSENEEALEELSDLMRETSGELATPEGDPLQRVFFHKDLHMLSTRIRKTFIDPFLNPGKGYETIYASFGVFLRHRAGVIRSNSVLPEDKTQYMRANWLDMGSRWGDSADTLTFVNVDGRLEEDTEQLLVASHVVNLVGTVETSRSMGSVLAQVMNVRREYDMFLGPEQIAAISADTGHTEEEITKQVIGHEVVHLYDIALNPNLVDFLTAPQILAALIAREKAVGQIGSYPAFSKDLMTQWGNTQKMRFAPEPFEAKRAMELYPTSLYFAIVCSTFGQSLDGNQNPNGLLAQTLRDELGFSGEDSGDPTELSLPEYVRLRGPEVQDAIHQFGFLSDVFDFIQLHEDLFGLKDEEGNRTRHLLGSLVYLNNQYLNVAFYDRYVPMVVIPAVMAHLAYQQPGFYVQLTDEMGKGGATEQTIAATLSDRVFLAKDSADMELLAELRRVMLALERSKGTEARKVSRPIAESWAALQKYWALMRGFLDERGVVWHGLGEYPGDVRPIV